jgi:hypothetical protein
MKRPNIVEVRQYIGAVIAERNILSPLCLFVKTSHINFAVACRNRKRFFRFLTQHNAFKLHITVNRQNVRLKLKYYLLPDPPPHFFITIYL